MPKRRFLMQLPRCVAKHKLIRRYEMTDAPLHDSQTLDALLNKDNTSSDVFADSAYRSKVRGSVFAGRLANSTSFLPTFCVRR
jgi:IS5 family transposase